MDHTEYNFIWNSSDLEWDSTWRYRVTTEDLNGQTNLVRHTDKYDRELGEFLPRSMLIFYNYKVPPDPDPEQYHWTYPLADSIIICTQKP